MRNIKGEIKIMTEDGEMRIMVCDITVEVALELLKLNTCNRNIRNTRIAQYVKDMTKGYWKINGMPIIVGNDGILKDGQHRLTAIVKSGVTLRDQIIIYLPSEQANGYDNQATRSVADMAKLENYDNKNLSNSSVTGAITARLKARDGFKSSISYTKTEIMNEVIKCNEACDFVREHYINCTRLPGLRKSGAIAAMINAYQNGYAEEKLINFCQVLSSGICFNGNEVSIIKLRNYLLESNNKGATKNIGDMYYRTQNILKAYETGKIVRVIRSSSTEYYGYC